MNGIKSYLLFVLAMGFSELACGQNFPQFLSSLPEVPYPKKFLEGSTTDWADVVLPPAYFKPAEYNSEWKPVGKVMLDPDYPLILIRHYNAEFEVYDMHLLVSFNNSGQEIATLLVRLSSDGEGARFAINPEKKIVVAKYGATEAIVKTYNYAAGMFSEDAPVRYEDIDELRDY